MDCPRIYSQIWQCDSSVADLMKTDNNIDKQVQEVHTIENNTEIEPPTYKEVSNIINKLKRNKAPGSTDNIPAELVKYGGYILKHRMYNLILLIWSKEQLPVEWLQGIICPIYKKGERTICSNYRPITLLNIAYKIFTIILNNRLSKIVESKLSDVRSGFRPNRSTLDYISIIFIFAPCILDMKISLLKSNWYTLCNYINIKID